MRKFVPIILGALILCFTSTNSFAWGSDGCVRFDLLCKLTGKGAVSPESSDDKILGRETVFKKNKNILVVYILVLSAISDYLNYTAGTFIDVVFAIPIYLILIAFIFYNHRWAMIVICWLSMMDMFAMGWLGTTEIIIAAISVVLTYHSFRVATALKKATYKS